MTFVEFVRAYANHYGSKGDKWLQEYVIDLLEAGMTTVESVGVVRQELTEYMALMKFENFQLYGFAWSKRDRLDYLLLDWARHEANGENYF